MNDLTVRNIMTMPAEEAENKYQQSMSRADAEYKNRPDIELSDLFKLLKKHGTHEDAVLGGFTSEDIEKMIDFTESGDINGLGSRVATIIRTNMVSCGHKLVERQGKYKSDMSDMVSALFHQSVKNRADL